MITIDLETAIAIVQQLYPSAADPLLSLELEITKGSNYRPYAVYFKFLITEYRQLTKADEVNFSYSILETAKQALMMQKSLDIGDDEIPEGQTVDELLALLTELECNDCSTISSNILGVNIY